MDANIVKISADRIAMLQVGLSWLETCEKHHPEKVVIRSLVAYNQPGADTAVTALTQALQPWCKSLIEKAFEAMEKEIVDLKEKIRQEVSK